MREAAAAPCESLPTTDAIRSPVRHPSPLSRLRSSGLLDAIRSPVGRRPSVALGLPHPLPEPSLQVVVPPRPDLLREPMLGVLRADRVTRLDCESTRFRRADPLEHDHQPRELRQLEGSVSTVLDAGDRRLAQPDSSCQLSLRPAEPMTRLPRRAADELEGATSPRRLEFDEHATSQQQAAHPALLSALSPTASTARVGCGWHRAAAGRGSSGGAAGRTAPNAPRRGDAGAPYWTRRTVFASDQWRSRL